MYFSHLFVILIFLIFSLNGIPNQKNRLARLAGGEVAKSFEFPFMTVINHKTMSCSGAIVSEEWVLTAAHCFAISHMFNLKASDVKVIAGLVNYVKQTDYTQIRRGLEVHIHPNYRVS